MGLGVIGVDIVEGQLEEAKAQGADHVFNSATNADYAKKILHLTNGGVDAVVNCTASKKSYDECPKMIKPGTGLLMIVGIPPQHIQISAVSS